MAILHLYLGKNYFEGRTDSQVTLVHLLDMYKKKRIKNVSINNLVCRLQTNNMCQREDEKVFACEA